MSKWSPTWSQCIIDSATGFPPVHPHSLWRSGTLRFASAVRSSGFGYSDFRFELSFRAREAMSGSLVQRRIFSTRSDQSPGRSAAVITPLSNSLGLLGSALEFAATREPGHVRPLITTERSISIFQD